MDTPDEAAERRYELPQTGGAFIFLIVFRRAWALRSRCPCPSPVPPLDSCPSLSTGAGVGREHQEPGAGPMPPAWSHGPRVASLALNERNMPMPPSWGTHFKCSGVTHGWGCPVGHTDLEHPIMAESPVDGTSGPEELCSQWALSSAVCTSGLSEVWAPQPPARMLL